MSVQRPHNQHVAGLKPVQPAEKAWALGRRAGRADLLICETVPANLSRAYRMFQPYER